MRNLRTTAKNKNYSLFLKLSDQSFSNDRLENFSCSLSSLINILSNNKNIKFEQLIEECYSQIDLLCKYSVIKRATVYFNNEDEIDFFSSKILMQCKIKNSNLKPIKVIGDGNCFYRTISKSLYGCESYFIEIKYRIIIEMILNIEELTDGNLIGQDSLKWLNVLSANSENLNNNAKLILQQVIVDSLPDGKYAGLWHIIATARSLSIDLQPFYPTKNDGQKLSECNRFLSKKISSHKKSQGKKFFLLNINFI